MMHYSEIQMKKGHKEKIKAWLDSLEPQLRGVAEITIEFRNKEKIVIDGDGKIKKFYATIKPWLKRK